MAELRLIPMLQLSETLVKKNTHSDVVQVELKRFAALGRLYWTNFLYTSLLMFDGRGGEPLEIVRALAWIT